MGDLHRGAVDGEQPGLGEGGQGPLLVGAEVVPVGAAAGVRPLVPYLDQTQHQAAGGGPVRTGEVQIGAFGGLGDGAADAAGAVVSGDGQALPGPLLPGGEQCVGEQGQGAGIVSVTAGIEVVQEYVHQAGFQTQPGEFGRPADRLGEFAAAHAAQRDGVVQSGHQARVGQTVVDEVGAHGEDGERYGAQGVEEGGALRGVLAEAERLLQLVHDQQDPVRAGQWCAGADPLGEGFLGEGLLAHGFLAHGLLADGTLAHGFLAHGLLADGALAEGPLADGPLADGLLAPGLLAVVHGCGQRVGEGVDRSWPRGDHHALPVPAAQRSLRRPAQQTGPQQ
ncbi:hypothetical protein GCM10010251_06250 [Streptomyces aurantiogriseus]|uniref:Uncharacterized protein n=1 Tax=Streptomyces aurantiogriseus TaxID=66870 RepID=A0A918EZK4_9ACTN|nr:hypothetical protein GCM10010251_06250 [Streptomyces aurantiogriseus]